MIVKTYKHSDGTTILTVPAKMHEQLGLATRAKLLVKARRDNLRRPFEITVEKPANRYNSKQIVKIWKINRSRVVPLPGGSRHPKIDVGIEYRVGVEEGRIVYRPLELRTGGEG